MGEGNKKSQLKLDIDQNKRGRIASSNSNSSPSPLSKMNMSKMGYRVVLMGPRSVGKTSIISQFLYDQFSDIYNPTIEEMYRGEFDFEGEDLAINIQDTGGSYMEEFPAMMEVSLSSADAVVLVFSTADLSSYHEATKIWFQTLQMKWCDKPIVVVGNKADLDRNLSEEVANKISSDWGCFYIESSAKDNCNIKAIFVELLSQVQKKYNSQKSNQQTLQVPEKERKSSRRLTMPAIFISLSPRNKRKQGITNIEPDLSQEVTPNGMGLMTRRKSLPEVPIFRIDKDMTTAINEKRQKKLKERCTIM